MRLFEIGPHDTFTPDLNYEIGKELNLLGPTGFDEFGETIDGTGFSVPDDRLLLTGVSVFVEEIPNRVLSIAGFSPGSKGTVEPGVLDGTLIYTPTVDVTVPETDTFTYEVTDGQNNFKTVEVTVTIEPFDNAPIITAPDSITMIEDGAFSFVGGQTVSVEEMDGQNLNVQLTAGSSISIASGSGVNVTVDEGATGTLVFDGTQQQVNDALGGLTYTPDANFFGESTLEITVQDLLATDSSVIHTVTHTVDIDVTPVNDEGQVIVPSDQTVLTTELPLVLSLANNNEISVNDVFDKMYAPDGDFVVEVTISIGLGELTLNDSTGLTSIDGSGTNTLVLQGTTADLNNALGAGLVLDNIPASNDGSPYEMMVLLDDLGNIGGTIPPVEDGFSILVVPPELPFAAADQYTVMEDSDATNFAVLINDYDENGALEGETLVITDIDVEGTRGTLSIVDDRRISFMPDADFAGQTTFTYTIEDQSDPGDGPSTATVTVNVAPINDEPGFTASDPASVLEDAGTVTVSGWVTDFAPDVDPMATPDPEASQVALQYLISNVSNTALFSVQPAIDPVSGDLTYTPAPDANGSSTFDVQVQDDGGTSDGGVDTSQVQTFTIEVIAVNDAPTFEASDEEVNEDAGPQTVTGWASNFIPGPDNEQVSPDEQTLLGYDVSEVSNPDLFSAGPSVNANGDLTYTPAADQWGESTFKVTVQDSGGVDNGGVDSYSEVFTITVNPINDKPSFTANAIPDPTSTEDDGPFSMQLISSFDAGPNENGENGQPAQAVQQYNVQVTAGASLFAQGPAVSTSGELTYTLNPDASGTATITVEVQDDGGTPDEDTSDPQEFTIVVQSENDAPVNLLGGDDDFAGNVQSTDDGVPLPFTTANGNPLEITDVDGDSSPSYTLDLVVIGGDTKGTLTFGTELTGTTGSGTANLQVTGTLADLNTAIDGLTFNPALGLNNEDVLVSVTTSDGGTSGDIGGIGNDTDTITIAVAPINDPPVAEDDEITTPEGSAVDFNVFADNGNGADSPGPNESFQDIDVLSFDTTGTEGTVELLDAETGEFRYTPPDDDFFGETTFTYTIQDDGQSRINDVIQDDFKQDTAVVTITVTEVNDAPIGVEDLLLVPPSESFAGNVVRFPVNEVLGNDSPGPANESDQTLSVVAAGDSERGAIVSLDDQGTSDPSDDEIVYQIPAGFDHVDRIEVTISDDGTTNGQADAKTATYTVEIRDVVRTTVSGYTYVDADQQGDMDQGEFGLGGILITMSGLDISGDVVQRTTMTDGNGYYEFSDMMPNGDQPYTLTQNQPPGWFDGGAVPGASGGVVASSNSIQFNLPVTGVGSDPENSVASGYNFTEWGLLASHSSGVLRDLLHSGHFGGAPTDTGIAWAASAAGFVQWYIDFGGWTDYVPGSESPENPLVFEVWTNGQGTQLTNTRTDNEHNVGWANENYYSSYQNGVMTGRVLGSALHNGLPSNDLGGEGEGYDDYVAAVDSVFGEVGVE